MSLAGRTAIVTGATRGIGRGIALGLAEQGAHIILTGRTATGPGSLADAAAAVEKAGGTCETHVVDHADDDDVTTFFEGVDQRLREQGRSLDVLVNNAYSAVPFLMRTIDEPFWTKRIRTDEGAPVETDSPGVIWDMVNGVGLRGNFICSILATRAMRARGGVVVNITSWAGMMSLFDPAYAIGKAGVDRMTAEFALGAPEKVRYFTLCPGFVATEALLPKALQKAEEARAEGRNEDEGGLLLWNKETPLFVGRVIAGMLARDGIVKDVNGKTVVAAEMAEKLDIYDEDGFRCLSGRSIRLNLMQMLPFLKESPLRLLIPRSWNAPWWIVRLNIAAVKYWG